MPPKKVLGITGAISSPFESRGDFMSSMKRCLTVRISRGVVPFGRRNMTIDGARSVSPGSTRKLVLPRPAFAQKSEASFRHSQRHVPLQPMATSSPSPSGKSKQRYGMLPGWPGVTQNQGYCFAKNSSFVEGWSNEGHSRAPSDERPNAP